MKLRSGFDSSRAWYSKNCKYCSLNKGLLCPKHEALLPNITRDALIVAGRYGTGVECNRCVDSGIVCGRCMYIALLRGSRHHLWGGVNLRMRTQRCLAHWVGEYKRRVYRCVLIMKMLARGTPLPIAIVMFIIHEFLGVDMYDPSEWAARYNMAVGRYRFKRVGALVLL